MADLSFNFAYKVPE